MTVKDLFDFIKSKGGLPQDNFDIVYKGIALPFEIIYDDEYVTLQIKGDIHD